MATVDGGSRSPGGIRVGIVIVAYNDAAVLERCLSSLSAGGSSAGTVYIVDNSTTEDVQRAFAGDARVRYFRTPDNLGFCGANNIAISESLEAGDDYVLLLNHDTVLAKGALDRLLERAESLRAGSIVTGKIRLLPDDGRLWYGGGYFSRWIGAGKNLGFNAPDRGQFDTPGEVSYATGCCMLVPAAAFRKVGLLQSGMFMYLDDIEFCLRARRAGFRIFYDPAAVIYHALGSGAILRQRPDYYLYFSIRNKPLVAQRPLYRLYLHSLALLFAAVKAVQFSLARGIPDRGDKVRAILWGAWDSLAPRRERYRRRFPRLFRTRMASDSSR